MSNRTPALAIAVGAIGLLLLAPVRAVVLTAGPGADCDHPDLHQAVSALPVDGVHEIRLTSGRFDDQAVAVEARSVSINGGYATCGAATSTGTTTLSGQGGVQRSVLQFFQIDGEVVLQNLAIVDGDPMHGGGGINFSGTGRLRLRDVRVANNVARIGGGIIFAGMGVNPAELRLEKGTIIETNLARSNGGGIELTGNVRLVAYQDDVTIRDNEALGTTPDEGRGGGIHAPGEARVELASPGLGNDGILARNRARFGGGIFANGTYAALEVTLSGVDPVRPLRIHGNRASVAGGGVMLRTDTRLAPVHLCATDFVIEGNRAPAGSAMMVDSLDAPHGPSIEINTCGPTPARVPLSSCSDKEQCNLIRDNHTLDEFDQPTSGSTIELLAGTMAIARTSLLGNIGGSVLHSNGAIDVTDSVVARNIVGGALLKFEQTAPAHRLLRNTIAGNSITAAWVIESADSLQFSRSILWQPGKATLRQSTRGKATSGIAFDHLLLSESASLNTPSASIQVGDPRFSNPAEGDYRLSAASPAIDFAATGGGIGRDDQSRSIDISLLANRFGPDDLGAYERQGFGPLLVNGDFDRDLAAWRVVAAGASTNDPFDDANGDGQSGSLSVELAYPPQPTVVARSQCVTLPLPGRYLLNGSGRATESDGFRDQLLLRWRMTRDASACGQLAIPIATGEHDLGSPADWMRPATPAVIEISPQQWTPSASVLIELVVVDAGGSVQNHARGWFDALSLALEGIPDDGGKLFADGFESNSVNTLR